jgi:hypothetical protein
MKKNKCVFCGHSGKNLLYSDECDAWAHKACLVYALTEQSFKDKAELAEQMAHVLADESAV